MVPSYDLFPDLYTLHRSDLLQYKSSTGVVTDLQSLG